MAHDLYENLIDDGYTFFTGVPDSALKVFQNTILVSDHQHVIATNEGQAVGIAVGAELAGKKTCVYLQNSGKMLDLIGYTNYTIVRGENNAN